MASGTLEKMLILAFDTAVDAESGGEVEAKDRFDVLVNPESYTLDYKVKTSEGQGHGTSGAQAKFEMTKPEELTFEFLFDNTGIIDGTPKPDGVFDDVDHLRKLLTEYRSSTHEPYHVKLIWGNLVFKGRAVELGITYKLFAPDGQPIRALAKAKFKGSIEEEKRARQEDRQSPDVTHLREVKAGDTLPLLCYEVYGDPRHYLTVARWNGLASFRSLEPGTTLRFPPIEKAAVA